MSHGMRFPTMWYVQPAKAQTSSVQPAHACSLIRAFARSLNIHCVKLLTEHQLEFLSLKEAAQARLNLHLSKYHIVGNHMSQLKFIFLQLQREPL